MNSTLQQDQNIPDVSYTHYTDSKDIFFLSYERVDSTGYLNFFFNNYMNNLSELHSSLLKMSEIM